MVLDNRARPQTTLLGDGTETLVMIWDFWATAKVIVFTWLLFQVRILTRQNLCRRGVMVGTTRTFCVFCGEVEESVHHLFVFYERISPV
jgi:hypothetical protein